MESPQESPQETFEPYRTALFGHCYRMLGSPTDAEDAVQDTLLKAWKSYDAFDGRSQLGTWLYRIATHVCIDKLRAEGRRELPVRLGSAGTIDDPLVEKPRTHWLEPVPDASALPQVDPERRAELRQTLRLAFVAALQHLPARQRAVLLLKDVLGFSTREIADTLETSEASVNSALQRARASLAARQPDARSVAPSNTQRELVDRYVDAFHRYDVDALVSLLREEGTLSMPPYTLWLRGHDSIARWLRGPGIGCKGSRLVATQASGSIAFGQYRKAEKGHHAWSLIVLELDADRIASMTHFLDVETLFPLFGLPLGVTFEDRQGFPLMADQPTR